MMMHAHGRGTIALINYQGDEAVDQINALLGAVVESEDEFDRWDALLTRVSRLEGGVNRNSSPNAIELLRNVYDCFLAKFPLFWGFWHRYAEIEFAIGGTETAEMVYERAVACCPISPELWALYCTFKMTTSHDVDIIRELFERGADFVGINFRGEGFWDKYVEFLERNREIVRAAKLCLSLIPIVQYDYKRYFDKFISLLGQCQLEDVLDADFLQVVIAQAEMHNEGLPEKGPLEKDRQIRELVLAHYVQVCQNVSVQVTKCWEFEQHLRPFFQAKPNTKAELAHWRKYLEFEEKGGDFERITFLYERCLVTCALYEEFWLRFARWMYDQGKEENTRLIFSRASCIFVSISAPAVRLAWARFEEKLGCVSVARDIYVAILDQKPEHEESMLALANLERRHEGCDAAVLLLEGYVGQSSDQYAGQLVAEQARILAQCKGKVDEARRAFSTKVDQLAASRTFWLQYFQFEISRPCTDQADGHKRVNAVYEEMLAKARLSPKHVKELAYRYMNFLMQCGSKDALDEYLELDQSLNRAKQVEEDVSIDLPTRS